MSSISSARNAFYLSQFREMLIEISVRLLLNSRNCSVQHDRHQTENVLGETRDKQTLKSTHLVLIRSELSLGGREKLLRRQHDD